MWEVRGGKGGRGKGMECRGKCTCISNVIFVEPFTTHPQEDGVMFLVSRFAMANRWFPCCQK